MIDFLLVDSEKYEADQRQAAATHFKGGSPAQLQIATASLKDFLQETGIRFLENLSSLARRETTGRPRDSDVMSASRQLFIGAGLMVESETMEMVNWTIPDPH